MKKKKKELYNAIGKNNLVEILDAIGDILWVNIWYAYSGWIKDEIDWVECRKNDAIQNIRNYVNWKLDWDVVIKLLDNIMDEIADSNFTKIKKKQTGGEKEWKIKKWPNFKEPDIQKIIDKYNLELNKCLELNK